MYFPAEVDFFHSWANFQADRLHKSKDTYEYKCCGIRAYKKVRGLASGCCLSLKMPELKLNFIHGNENITHSVQTEYSGRKKVKVPVPMHFLSKRKGRYCCK